MDEIAAKLSLLTNELADLFSVVVIPVGQQLFEYQRYSSVHINESKVLYKTEVTYYF